MLHRLILRIQPDLCVALRTSRLQCRSKTYQSKVRNREETPTIVHTGKIEKDVLLYAHSNPRQFKIMLACFAGASLFFFVTGDSFRVVGQSLRERRYSSLEPETAQSHNWAVRMWKFKDGTFHSVFSALFMAFGAVCLFAAVYAPARYLRSIVLLKGGDTVCLSTYAPFGSTKHLVYNVDQVHSMYPLVEGRPNLISVPKRLSPFYLNSTGVFSNRDELKRVLRQSNVVK